LKTVYKKFHVLCLLFTLAASTVSQTRIDKFIPLSPSDSLDATYFIPSSPTPINGYPAILFVHGFGGSKNSTLASAQIYAQSGFATLCYSVRGHGNSSGSSSIMSIQERLDLSKVLSYTEDLPFVDTTSIGITGGSQGGLHGLWAVADNLPVKAITADVMIPDWASDIFRNGAIKYSLLWLLKNPTVHYTDIRDTLCNLLASDDYDSLRSIFSRDRDLDISGLSLSQKPLILLLKYQDFYFGANSGINFFKNYTGLKKLYLGTVGHYSDVSWDESYYQFSWITSWFNKFLKNIETGILLTPKYTYAYSSLPVDSSGYFTWQHIEANELPVPTYHRLYLKSGSQMEYTFPSSENDYFLLSNNYKNTNYTIDSAYFDGFKGARFDAALEKQTLIFETTQLNDDVTMMGAPRIKFFVTSNSNKFPVNVQIYETDSLGNKYFICRINYVFRSNNPCTNYTLEAEGYYHAHKFQKSNKIRVEICNIDISNRKTFPVIPFVLPVFEYSQTEIYTNLYLASYIDLPLLNAGLVTRIDELIADQTILLENQPNPFNPYTTIKYSLPKSSFVSLKIFDILGREVKTIFEGRQQGGYYSYVFDGSALTSGVYFCRIETANISGHSVSSIKTHKMLLIK
jgi:predicted acyl esterase